MTNTPYEINTLRTELTERLDKIDQAVNALLRVSSQLLNVVSPPTPVAVAAPTAHPHPAEAPTQEPTQEPIRTITGLTFDPQPSDAAAEAPSDPVAAAAAA
jgi:hypothetical protein